MKLVEIARNAFANDLVLYAGSEKDLQDNLNIWETARNMTINTKKTKVMTIGKECGKINI